MGQAGRELRPLHQRAATSTSRRSVSGNVASGQAVNVVARLGGTAPKSPWATTAGNLASRPEFPMEPERAKALLTPLPEER